MAVTNPERADAARALVTAISSRMRLFLENAEQCLGQLDDQQVWFRAHPRDNAIGNLIQHVIGNIQQIVNNIEGRPDVRDRPAEFSAKGGRSRKELETDLRRVIQECCRVIESLPLDRITEAYRIQNEDTTIAYAFVMAVSHFGLHLGQMQFIGKSLLHDRYQEALRRLPK